MTGPAPRPSSQPAAAPGAVPPPIAPRPPGPRTIDTTPDTPAPDTDAPGRDAAATGHDPVTEYRYARARVDAAASLDADTLTLYIGGRFAGFGDAASDEEGPDDSGSAAEDAPDDPGRPAEPPPTGGLGAKAAIASSVADQGVAAFTNIIVLVVAARLSTAAGFAVFSMVYMVFTVLLGIGVSYVGQALVLERGEGRVRAACRSAVTFTAVASTVIGLCMAGALSFVPGGTAGGLAVLGLVLPIVLTQDGMRYCFSALRLPHYALAADTVRLAVAVPALAVQPHGAGAVRLVAVWGISAVPALLVGAALLWPKVRHAPVDLRAYVRRGHLGQRFVIEFGVGNATSQLAVVGLGLFAAPLAVGALRGATTLFGPMNVLFNSATAFGPPLLNRVRGTDDKVRATAVLGIALAWVAVAWTVVLMLLPDHIGRQLLGATWASSSALLPASGSQYAGIALGTSALLTLRVLRPRATLPIQVVFSLASVVFMLVGYAADGVLGAAWGLFLGSALKATALWLRIAAVRRGTGAGAGRQAPGAAEEGVTAGSSAGPR